MEFSLFYFAEEGNGERYRLLLDGARFADQNGFTAVWVPERHFHPVGGVYPNPAVVGAAVAAVTDRVQIRAGSVVTPLHHPLRLAEEWAVVDNLSGGRVGLSLASGWNQRDFVLRPESFESRRDSNVDAVETLRGLWRGEPWRDGATEVTAFPRPVGPLRLWLTSAGTVDTFRAAGRAGTGVLTHLVKQDFSELAKKVTEYRRELAASGSSWRGHVTLMLHTFVDADADRAEAVAREPLERYLVGALSPFRPGSAHSAGSDVGEKARAAVRPAADRYLRHDGLIGGPRHAAEVVARCREAGVDEIACLIDFGIETDIVLKGLEQLDAVRAQASDH
ncbi:MupA/Atu3671 family FMN-dependent luciferase-like monooxygenase [Lentzea sp. NPDC004789]